MRALWPAPTTMTLAVELLGNGLGDFGDLARAFLAVADVLLDFVEDEGGAGMRPSR